MSVSSSRQVLGSKRTQTTKAQSYETQSDIEELEQYESQRWELYETEINSIEESLIIISETEINKRIQKEGIVVDINAEGSITQFSKPKVQQLDNDKMQQMYQKIRLDFSSEIERLKLALAQKQSETKILLTDLSAKSLQIEKMTLNNKLHEEQSKRDFMRIQNQNKLLNDQINKLKIEILTTIKSTQKVTLHKIQHFSLQTQTDFQTSNIVTEPRRPGVQILKIDSGQPVIRKGTYQVRQTGSSPFKNGQGSPIGNRIITPSRFIQTPRNSQSQQSFLQQNKYLRDIIQSLNQQLQQSKRSTRVTPSLNTPDIVTLRNRIAQLQSKNRILQNQKQRIRLELSVKDNQYKKIQTQIKNQSFERTRKDESIYQSRLDESRYSKQIQTLNNTIKQLQNQNRQLIRKLDDEKRDKNSQLQKYQLQVNRMTTDLKNVNDQKTNMQKQLSSAKSMVSLENHSKQQFQRKIRELETQIQRLTNEKNNNSTRYVSTTSYQYLKQQHERQKKSLTQTRDKYRQQVTTVTTNINKLTQQNSQIKNQKQRIESQLSRLNLQKTRLSSQLQKYKTQTQTLNKKLKQNSLQNSRSIQSLNVSYTQRHNNNDSLFLTQQNRKLKNQNQKLKQLINQYKQLMNNRNLTAMNQKLHSYELQIKQKNMYIIQLQTHLSDRQQRIQFLENDIIRFQSKVSTPNNECNEYNDWMGQLEYQQKVSTKLDSQVKELKIRTENLEDQLFEKQNLISVLNQRLAELTSTRRSYDINQRMSAFDQMQNQYNEMVQISRGRTHRIQSRAGGTNDVQVQDLLAEIQVYKNKYEKALETSNYLRQCIYEAKKTTGYCNLCLEYQDLVAQLQRRINIYQVMMMSQLRRLFVHCEEKLNETGYSWLQVQNVIYDLRSKTLSHRGFETTYVERRTERNMNDSPITARENVFERSRRSPTQRRLDDLIRYDNLNQQTIATLMLRITEAVIQQKPKFILPDYVYVLYLDLTSPSRMKVQLVQIKQLLNQDYLLYLAPQSSTTDQHTQQSLIWNLGTIFHLILHKKLPFRDETSLLDSTKLYRYQNKLLPNFKPIIQGMLQRDPSKRLSLQKIYTLLSAQDQQFSQNQQ